MNDPKHFLKLGNAVFVLGVVLVATLTGCISYVDRPPRTIGYQPSGMDAGLVVEDDYVYYPGYEVYYSNSRRQYIYLDGRSWVSRPAPRGVSVDVLFASPSVRMDFRDSPSHHHTAIARQYPRNWAPSGRNPGRPEDQNGGQRGRNGGR